MARLFGTASDLYVGKSTLLKLFLLGGVATVSTLFIWYTFSVITILQRDTQKQAETYVRLWQLAANSSSAGGELQFIFNEIILKASFPIVVTDTAREPLFWRNLSGISSTDTSAATLQRVREISRRMHGYDGAYPLHFAGTHVNYFLYGDSEVIGQLQMMPFIQIGIVLAFLIVGIIGFQNIRKSEERHIWVGMAKETAHQLGTPLSSLMGWLEVLEQEHPDRPASPMLTSTVDNMKVDVQRLQRVTNRFGQIGSLPELKPYDVNEQLTEVAEYYRRRLPFHGQGIQLTVQPGDVPPVPLNPELFGWALENLTKNAIQAVDARSGEIALRSALSSDHRQVLIEIQDNGVGISAAMARKIFRPGFTSKKRGWGLGLTLVKRIIEEYHGGVVRLERSKPGETVFQIALPIEARYRKD